MDPALVYPVLAGTELETAVDPAPVTEVEVEVDLLDSDVDIRVLGSGGGKDPPERKEGHSERSSGSDEDVGDKWERIAAASSNWTCWCLLRTNLDASRQ